MINKHVFKKLSKAADEYNLIHEGENVELTYLPDDRKILIYISSTVHGSFLRRFVPILEEFMCVYYVITFSKGGGEIRVIA